MTTCTPHRTRYGIIGKIAVYFVIPIGCSAVLVAMYFSGNETLQSIVAPHSFNNMRPDSGREFGLLENLQHLIILVMAGVALWAVKSKPLRIEKAGFALLAAFAVFVLLEEIDYGLHYYEFLMGIEWAESAEVRNLHNQGELADIMKDSVDVGIAVLFLLVAWGCTRCPWAWLRYLAPSKWFTLTLGGMLIMRIITHALGDHERELAGPLGKVGAISRGNLSEFRELTIYYMFMVYVVTLACYRDYSGQTSETRA